MRTSSLVAVCIALACSSKSVNEAAPTDAAAGPGGSAGKDAGGGAAGSGAVAGSGGMAGSGGVAGSGGTDAGGPDAGLSYVEAVKASGPVAWWRFEEPSGATQVTDVGKKYIGVLSTSPYNVSLDQPGAFGSSRALSLDHEGANVDFGDVFDFDGSSSFTVELLVNPSNFDGGHNLLWKLETNNGWITYIFPQGDAGAVQGIRVGLFSGGIKKDANGLLVAAPGWTYVAFTFNGSKLCTYRGVSQGSVLDEQCSADVKPFTMLNTSAPLKLGSGFQGSVDELTIYTKALEQLELQKHYAAALSEGL